MEENGKGTSIPARRLCNEIKLFDLCDRDACGEKDGRFCTNPELLARFEAISDEERMPQRDPATDRDDAEEDDEAGCGEGFDEEYGDDYGDEGDGWEEE